MELQVIVRGKSKTGKSTVSKLIRNTLRDNGISCSWMDEEDSEPYELDYRKVVALADKEGFQVNIVSETVNRKSAAVV